MSRSPLPSLTRHRACSLPCRRIYTGFAVSLRPHSPRAARSSVPQRPRSVPSSSPAMAAPAAGPAARRPSLALLLLLLLVAVFAGSSLAQAPGTRTDAAAARKCTYTVKVKTSCASPRGTTDAVSVAFGDAYRNEAYGARLPVTTFEPCGADTFRVRGACGYGVCYLYLRRAGRDGWAPEWVQVLEPGAAAGEKPATFYFGAPLPDGVWYGHNRCPKAAAKMANASSAAAAAASPLG